jgi:c-di-GMP-binding flagellar brake protein YcgR
MDVEQHGSATAGQTAADSVATGSSAARQAAADSCEQGGMEQDEAQQPAVGSERRAYPRHAVDCAASITPIAGAGRVQARLVDLSLGGCRLETEQRFQSTFLMRVEVQFELRGIAFRIVGVTVGSRQSKSFAIRFLDMSPRRRQALVEVLAEVAEINAVKAASLESESDNIKSVAAAARATETVAPAATAKAASGATVASEVAVAFPVTSSVAPPAAPETVAAAAVRAAKAAAPPEKRAHGRHHVDTRAKLLLVKTNISMPGQILNLSQGGCRLRTDERFNVGIFVRVETEFYLHGLPFRLGGVTQAIMDKHTIGVRFLDMSDRKRGQLTDLIAEIEAAASGEITQSAE